MGRLTNNLHNYYYNFFIWEGQLIDVGALLACKEGERYGNFDKGTC